MEAPKGKAAAKEEELMPASTDDWSVEVQYPHTGKKDPNKPKRPTCAFFLFLEEFGKSFKEDNPNLTSVAEVGRFGGEKWKSMSPAEKTPYEAKAAEEKNEYRKLMDAYNKRVNTL